MILALRGTNWRTATAGSIRCHNAHSRGPIACIDQRRAMQGPRLVTQRIWQLIPQQLPCPADAVTAELGQEQKLAIAQPGQTNVELRRISVEPLQRVIRLVFL